MHRLFYSKPSEVGKTERLKYIDQKTEDSTINGKLQFYCKELDVSKQVFYDYQLRKKQKWKYADIADKIRKNHDVNQFDSPSETKSKRQLAACRQETAVLCPKNHSCMKFVR